MLADLYFYFWSRDSVEMELACHTTGTTFATIIFVDRPIGCEKKTRACAQNKIFSLNNKSDVR